MIIKSLDQGKKIAYEQINTNKYVITDEYVWDFSWGYVFFYCYKKEGKEQNIDFYSVRSYPCLLVDKINGSVHHISRRLGEVLDTKIEKYRESKGYPQAVKMPLKQGFEQLNTLEQVRALFEIGEIIQIKRGVEIIRKNQLFDLDLFQKIVFNNAFAGWSFEEHIASFFRHKFKHIILNDGLGNKFPDEFTIFDDATMLTFSGTKTDFVPDYILQLSELSTIEIWFSEIEEITPNICSLKKLNYVEVMDSTLGKQANLMLEKLREEYDVKVEFFGKVKIKQ